jgi:hypothetical protein
VPGLRVSEILGLRWEDVDRRGHASGAALRGQRPLHRHSIGYLLGGADDIVETYVSPHLASAFLTYDHAVWAESPFKEVEPLGVSVETWIFPDPPRSLTWLGDARRRLST